MWVAGQILIGLFLLVIGGEILVRGAAALAAAFRITPLVIGLTVVAFGTSAPELGVSLQAALTGKADVAIGNVVGSNIVNILVVLGASAIITPLIVSSQLIRLDVPLMIAAAVCMWLASLDGVVSRLEGSMLFTALLVYIALSIRASRRESAEVADEFSEYSRTVSGVRGTLTQIGMFLGGLVLLTIGSRLLVEGAVTVATKLGVSQLVIGLTIVAIGTSLPEVVTSVVASIRGQRDIAVGNVVGSNLFNVLCVLGLTGAVSPTGVPVSEQAIAFDLPVMLAVSIICFPIFWTGSLIRRYEGALFLAYFALYTVFLILTSTRPEASASFGRVSMYVVIPLTLLTLVISFAQGIRERRAKLASLQQPETSEGSVDDRGERDRRSGEPPSP